MGELAFHTEPQESVQEDNLPQPGGNVWHASVHGVALVLKAGYVNEFAKGALGSVPVVVGDERYLVRVYGDVGDVPDKIHRANFEKRLRSVCEGKRCLKALFDLDVDYGRSRRFNPSRILKDKGWV